MLIASLLVLVTPILIANIFWFKEAWETGDTIAIVMVGLMLLPTVFFGGLLIKAIEQGVTL